MRALRELVHVVLLEVAAQVAEAVAAQEEVPPALVAEFGLQFGVRAGEGALTADRAPLVDERAQLGGAHPARLGQDILSLEIGGEDHVRVLLDADGVDQFGIRRVHGHGRVPIGEGRRLGRGVEDRLLVVARAPPGHVAHARIVQISELHIDAERVVRPRRRLPEVVPLVRRRRRVAYIHDEAFGHLLGVPDGRLLVAALERGTGGADAGQVEDPFALRATHALGDLDGLVEAFACDLQDPIRLHSLATGLDGCGTEVLTQPRVGVARVRQRGRELDAAVRVLEHLAQPCRHVVTDGARPLYGLVDFQQLGVVVLDDPEVDVLPLREVVAVHGFIGEDGAGEGQEAVLGLELVDDRVDHLRREGRIGHVAVVDHARVLDVEQVVAPRQRHGEGECGADDRAASSEDLQHDSSSQIHLEADVHRGDQAAHHRNRVGLAANERM